MTALPRLVDDAPAVSNRIGNGILALTLILYLAILVVDPLRKTTGLSGSSIAAIYLVTIVTYAAAFSVDNRPRGMLPSYLPLALAALTIWCGLNAVIQHVPAQFAVLGWSSYVFFVPLAYVGAQIFADDQAAITVMRAAVIAGGVVGIGTIASAILGSSAPTLLQPIVPSVAVHTASGGDIYLAPSIFADSEEAAEQLLISLFAWTALMLGESGAVRRGRFGLLGLVIFGGLIAASRRAGIDIAVAGIIVLLIVGGGQQHSSCHHGRRPVRTGGRRSLTLALGMALIASLALISSIGGSVVLNFLTSRALGAPLKLMVSTPNPWALSGQGTGTSTQGANLLGALSFSGIDAHETYTGLIINGRAFTTAEGGLSKTWLELGLVGVLLYAAVFFSAIAPVLRRFRSLDSIGRALLILVLGLGILFLKGHQSLDDPLTQPLYWLAAGGAWGRLRSQSVAAQDCARHATRWPGNSAAAPPAATPLKW